MKEMVNVNNIERKTEGLAAYASIRYLSPKETVFSLTAGGFLSLRIKNESEDIFYPRVNLHRAFPFTDDSSYISVRDPEGNEIGMIRNIYDFPGEVVKLFEKELNRRYFSPVIQSVTSLREEFGYIYWEVQTDVGVRRFTSRKSFESLLFVTEDHIIVTDVDSNRYEIPSLQALDSRSIRLLEANLL